ncbi:hypothetical protein FACS189472_07300 [Alphaproteobacteria bacterium]|nr:hypothetical protein FACS189472_07300 [Alphaproteobacteria bacterium]
MAKYKGFNYASRDEVMSACNEFHCNIQFYVLKGADTKGIEIYGLGDYFEANKEWKTLNMKITNGSDNMVHATFVGDTEKLIHLAVCEKCHNFCKDIRRYENKISFDEHVAICTGPQSNELHVALTDSVPYCPIFDKNPLYAYMFAKGLTKYYKHITDYITFDFETVEDRAVDEGTTKTKILARICPHTVAASLDSKTEIYFDVRDGSDFIHQFIAALFEHARRVIGRSQYAPIPGVDERTMEHINYLATSQPGVTVLGFNSAKFDMNLFLNELDCEEWTVDPHGCLCTDVNMKMLQVGEKVGGKLEKGTLRLVFKDFINFVSPGTLESHAKDFGGVANTKSHMAYEAYDTETADDVLSLTYPFSKDEFTSILKKKKYSDAEYVEALQCWYKAIHHFSCQLIRMDATARAAADRLFTRWDYLRHYNIRDTQIMRPMIDNLIANMWADKVDMLRNFSLAANASALKYSMAWEDFDVNADYSSQMPDNIPLFELSLVAWIKMCSGYRTQDRKKKRSVSDNVSVQHYEEFRNMFRESGCHLCSRRFTSIHKPTLDRIDNDLPHTVANVRPCCELCNKSRSNGDADEVRMLIKKRQFVVLRRLPTTVGACDGITAEQAVLVHDRIRGAIAGGMAQVWHRYNVAGETKINHLSVAADGKVESTDSEHVMTNVIGTDWNSLYPFSMGSIRTPWNPYDNGVMYMPANLMDNDVVRSSSRSTDVDIRRTTARLLMGTS